MSADRTKANQIRGLLAEFGIIVPQGIGYVAKQVPELIEDATNELPGTFRFLVQRLLDHLKELDRQVDEIVAQIESWHLGSASTLQAAPPPAD